MGRCTFAQYCKPTFLKGLLAKSVDKRFEWQCLPCPDGRYAKFSADDHFEQGGFDDEGNEIPAGPKCLQLDSACPPQERCSEGQYCERTPPLINRWRPWSCKDCPNGQYSGDQDHWEGNDTTGHAVCTPESEACKEQPTCGKGRRYQVTRCALKSRPRPNARARPLVL